MPRFARTYNVIPQEIKQPGGNSEVVSVNKKELSTDI